MSLQSRWQTPKTLKDPGWKPLPKYGTMNLENSWKVGLMNKNCNIPLKQWSYYHTIHVQHVLYSRFTPIIHDFLSKAGNQWKRTTVGWTSPQECIICDIKVKTEHYRTSRIHATTLQYNVSVHNHGQQCSTGNVLLNFHSVNATRTDRAHKHRSLTLQS